MRPAFAEYSIRQVLMFCDTLELFAFLQTGAIENRTGPFSFNRSVSGRMASKYIG